MTNNEAIEILQRADSVCIETDEALEAYYYAIKALEFISENYPETFKDYLNGEQIRE